MANIAEPGSPKGPATPDRSKVLMGALACIALGVFGVLAGQRYFGDSKQPAPSPRQSVQTPEVRHPELETPTGPEKPAPNAAAAESGAGPTAPGAAAPSPEPGSAVKPPSELSGAVSSGIGGTSNVPVNPVVIGDPNTPPKAAFAEVSVAATVDDVAGLVDRVHSIAAVARGYAWTYRLPRTNDSTESRGVVVVVPASELESVVKKLATVAGATVLEQSSGDADERNARLERPLRSRLSELEKERQKLLIKFLDDAPSVVEAGEKIADLKAQLGGFKRVPPDRAAIRVMFPSG